MPAVHTSIINVPRKKKISKYLRKSLGSLYCSFLGNVPFPFLFFLSLSIFPFQYSKYIDTSVQPSPGLNENEG